MTTTSEMALNSAGGLGHDLLATGIEWVHLPIEDFGAPSPDIFEGWPAVSERARAILSCRGRVLAHCRGGCGRSGMVVLRLMAECGEVPDIALTRLRAIRPCAVETDAQMRWAMAAHVRSKS